MTQSANGAVLSTLRETAQPARAPTSEACTRRELDFGFFIAGGV